MYRLWRNEKQERNDACVKGDGTVTLDVTGRKNGRGAYLCISGECLHKARKNRGLERSFKMSIPEQIYENLEKEFRERNER